MLVCLSVCLPIQHSINTQVRVTWSQLATPVYYRPIIISVVMRFLQQMTGITPVLVYLEPIFSQSNVSLQPRLDIYFFCIDYLCIYQFLLFFLLNLF